jgi:glutamyl-tRNA synthetase
VREPALARGLVDRKRSVAHPQARMATLVGVRRRAAPVLLQEEAEPLGGRSEVTARVHWPDHRVGLDALVEPGDEALEEGATTERLVGCDHLLADVTHRAILPAAAVRYGQEVTVRVRFAPSPTGSLHLGNALSAAANRAYADAQGGALVLRIDDTDPTRSVVGGEEAILADLEWLGIGWDEGPLRQSERGTVYASALERALGNGAVRDDDGSVRLSGTTLARADGTATYQLATVADDLALGITHIVRGSDHRPNEDVQRRIARSLGGELPEVIHHGLLLGEDGKKLSKRAEHASVADLRREGIPASAVRTYLEELGLPRHDVRYDAGRVNRLAIDAIAGMPDAELAAAAGAPVQLARALRGARTLVEAAEIAHQILEPVPVALGPEGEPTMERFAELRLPLPEVLTEDDARAIVRELKAVGGNLKQLRLALTGAERGPELWTVVASVPRDEALRRATAAITPR